MSSDEQGKLIHELNNLLAVIVSYSELVGQALAPDDPLRADLEEIDRASRRAAELVAALARR